MSPTSFINTSSSFSGSNNNVKTTRRNKKIRHKPISSIEDLLLGDKDSIDIKDELPKPTRRSKVRHKPVAIGVSFSLEELGLENNDEIPPHLLSSPKPENSNEIDEQDMSNTAKPTPCLRKSLKSTGSDKSPDGECRRRSSGGVYFNDTIKTFKASVDSTQVQEELHQDSFTPLDPILIPFNDGGRPRLTSECDESGTFDYFHEDPSQVTEDPLSLEKDDSRRLRISAQRTKGFYGSISKMNNSAGDLTDGGTLTSGDDSLVEKPRVRRGELTKKSSVYNMIIGSLRNVTHVMKSNDMDQQKKDDPNRSNVTRETGDLTPKKKKNNIFKKGKKSRQDFSDMDTTIHISKMATKKKHSTANKTRAFLADYKIEDMDDTTSSQAFTSTKKGFSSLVKDRRRKFGRLDISDKTDVTSSEFSIEFSLMKNNESSDKLASFMRSF